MPEVVLLLCVLIHAQNHTQCVSSVVHRQQLFPQRLAAILVVNHNEDLRVHKAVWKRQNLSARLGLIRILSAIIQGVDTVKLSWLAVHRDAWCYFYSFLRVYVAELKKTIRLRPATKTVGLHPDLCSAQLSPLLQGDRHCTEQPCVSYPVR